METNFNFKSQICTDKIQSERLLSLGLKKETADMVYRSYGYIIDEFGDKERRFKQPTMVVEGWESKYDIPAWSLGRLIEMLPSPIKLNKDLPTFHPYAFLELSPVAVSYTWEDYDSGVDKFGIICLNGVVQESNPTTNWERHLNKILDFPTRAMRDAFKENFDPDIEICKELL